jgi:hypothetical protein
LGETGKGVEVVHIQYIINKNLTNLPSITSQELNIEQKMNGFRTCSSSKVFQQSDFLNKFAGLPDNDLFAWLIISCPGELTNFKSI